MNVFLFRGDVFLLYERVISSQNSCVLLSTEVEVVAYWHSQQIYIYFVSFGSTNNKFLKFLPIFFFYI